MQRASINATLAAICAVDYAFVVTSYIASIANTGKFLTRGELCKVKLIEHTCAVSKRSGRSLACLVARIRLEWPARREIILGMLARFSQISGIPQPGSVEPLFFTLV
jgi:hypothetical protein